MVKVLTKSGSTKQGHRTPWDTWDWMSCWLSIVTAHKLMLQTWQSVVWLIHAVLIAQV